MKTKGTCGDFVDGGEHQEGREKVHKGEIRGKYMLALIELKKSILC